MESKEKRSINHTMRVLHRNITKSADLGRALKMREFKVLKSEGEIVSFNGGTIKFPRD